MYVGRMYIIMYSLYGWMVVEEIPVWKLIMMRMMVTADFFLLLNSKQQQQLSFWADICRHFKETQKIC